MILVERHIINSNHQFYGECDSLCFRSKNLYNQGLYNVRQHYFETKKYLSYVENFHVSKSQESYTELPAKVSNQTLKLVDQNFKSFFALLKMAGTTAQIPGYIDKEGRYITRFEKQALGKLVFKKTGMLKLSKTDIYIQTQVDDWTLIKEVRVVPRNNHYAIEVVYEREERVATGDTIASIDPGVNNLVTVAFNKKEYRPFIINGKPLKSINQFYNKERAEKQGKLEFDMPEEVEHIEGERKKKSKKRRKSNKLIKLTNKRNEKIKDYMHKSSRLLVNQLVGSQTKTLVIGKNVSQKQDSNMSKKNNQNFVNIPTFRFLEMIAYKAKIEGIEVIWQEESYTSKASFISDDFIPTYGENVPDGGHKFAGYRASRGLYKIKGEKKYINADLNGALNIMKKAIPNAFVDGIEGIAVCPRRLTPAA